MPFKKMTIREQIAAKRELKRLRQLERDISSDHSGTRVAAARLPDEMAGAVNAAVRLGYKVVLRAHSSGNGQHVAYAYRIGGRA